MSTLRSLNGFSIRHAAHLGIFAAIIVLLLSSHLYGQATGTSQSITGTVYDTSGAVIPGATVTVRNNGTGSEATQVSSAAGTFVVPGLPVGAYQLTVSVEGFQTVVRNNISVPLGTSPNVVIELPIGVQSQTVTVSALVRAIDTTSTTTGVTRSTEELSSLPLLVSGGSRNPAQYLASLPGVSVTPQFPNTYGQIQGVGDNGGYGTVVGYKVDGINGNFFGIGTLDGGLGTGNTYRPSPDLVEEIRLVTNTNAEDSWNLGVNFELVTKSGGNLYHGSAYEYGRNEALNTRDYFSGARPVDRQHDFGGILSGALQQDKHFFIVSYSAYRQRYAVGSALLQVPTAKMRAGDFSEFLGPELRYADGTPVTDQLGRPVLQGSIYDPATTRPDGRGGFIRDPFAYNGQLNVVDPARLSAISSFFQQGYPTPNLGGIGQNFNTFPLPSLLASDYLYAKTDHNFSRHRLSLAYEHTLRNGLPACGNVFGNAYEGFSSLLNACSTNKTPVYRPRVNYTWAPDSNLLVGVHGGIVYRPRYITVQGDASTGGEQAGLEGVFTPETPSVSISGLTGFGTSIPNIAANYWTSNLTADATWLKGTHQIKAGYALQQLGVDLTSNILSNGSFSFTGAFSGLPSLGLVVNPTTGQLEQRQLAAGQRQPGLGYADFLLGYVNSGNVRSAFHQIYPQYQHGWFVQDQWRATPRLTVNYGLRYDLFLASREIEDRIGNFCLTCPNPGAGGLSGALEFFGEGAGRNGRTRVLNTYSWSFAPRLGVAYQSDARTVWRAYYGLHRYPMSALFDSGRGTANYGWGAALSRTSAGPTEPAFIWDNGTFTLPSLPNLSPALLNGSGVGYINYESNKPPNAHALGAAIERELWGGLSVRAEYAGKVMNGLPTNNIVTLNSIPLEAAQQYGPLLFENINSANAQAAGIPIPYPGFNGPVYQALRPYPQYQNINEIGALVKNVRWHSGQFSVQKRTGHLSVLASVTLTRTRTNDPLPVVLDQTTNSGPNSVQHTTLRDSYWPDTGSSGLAGNRPRQLVLSYTYRLPVGRGRRFLGDANSVVDAIFGGWEVAGIQTYADGTSFSIQSGASIPTFGPIFPQRVPEEPLRTGLSCGDYDPSNPARNRYLNPAAFRDPAPFQLGDTFVPDVRTCAYINEDLSLSKSFELNRARLKFGASFFNAFNRRMFYGLSANTSNTETYGQFSNVTPGRAIQLHLKVDF